METIDQDPNDIVLQEPAKANNSLPFKIATCVLAGTTILFGLIAFFNGNKSAETKKDDGKTDSSQSTEATTTEEKEDLALKNFDVNIGKLVNAAGFNYGSILSIKTNADGTYMIGEVKNGESTKLAYRALPSGDWTKANVVIENKKDSGSYTYCKDIEKSELEIFNDYKSSSGMSAQCWINPAEEDPEEYENTVVDDTTIPVSEALKNNNYKDA